MKSGSKFWPPEDMKFEFPFRPYLINFLVQSRRRDRVDPKMLGKPSERAYKAIGQLKLWCPLVVKTCCHFSGSRFLLIFGNLFWCLTYPPWWVPQKLQELHILVFSPKIWIWFFSTQNPWFQHLSHSAEFLHKAKLLELKHATNKSCPDRSHLPPVKSIFADFDFDNNEILWRSL